MPPFQPGQRVRVKEHHLGCRWCQGAARWAGEIIERTGDSSEPPVWYDVRLDDVDDIWLGMVSLMEDCLEPE